MGGLLGLHELPVTVVHQDGGAGLTSFTMRHISPISATDREARVEYPLDRWISTAFTRGSAAARASPSRSGQSSFSSTCRYSTP